MTDHTILVVDADPETQEVLVATLEAAGYLVFTASGRDISTGLAEKISPALIFLKPAAISVEGFATCKTIHNSEKFVNIPVILLASLKGPLDPRYTTFYGVVDYLRLPLHSDEILTKTRKLLVDEPFDLEVTGNDFGMGEEARVTSDGAVELEETQDIGTDYDVRLQDTQTFGDEYKSAGEESAYQDETLRLEETNSFESDYDALPQDTGTDANDFASKEDVPAQHEQTSGEDERQVRDTESDERSGIGQPNEDYRYHEAHESIRKSFYNKGSKRRTKKAGLFIPVVIVTAGIAVVLAGFLAYRFFFSSPASVPVPVVPPLPLSQQEAAVPPPVQEPQKQEQVAVESMPAETKEIPSGKPPVTLENKADGKPVYSVQLGAFKNEATAVAITKKYVEKGYEAHTLMGETVDKGTLYRVLVGTFQDRKQAVQLATRISDKEKIQTTVFSGRKK